MGRRGKGRDTAGRTRVAALLAAALFAAGPLARADDGIVLRVQHGHVPGQVILSWTGGGSASDLYRGTTPDLPNDAAHRLGATAASQWTDDPPAASIQFFEVADAQSTRLAAEVLDPYVFLVVDSSGSLNTTTGFGAPACPGALDTRLDHIKCAVAAASAEHGAVVLGLGRFRLTTTDAVCTDGCQMSGAVCAGCDPATGIGCTSSMASDARLEVLTPLAADSHASLIRWNDFTCDTCGASGSNPEFFSAGSSPIAGALKGTRRYWQGLQALDGTVLWPEGPGFDPIRSDPLRGAFLPGG